MLVCNFTELRLIKPSPRKSADGGLCLLAGQDIAVDGWAITMLSEKNVGLGSTVNAAGQTAGYFISFTGFLVLNSYGFIGLGGFLQFWGVVFLLSAVCVLATKEKPSPDTLNVPEAYMQVRRQERSTIAGWARSPSFRRVLRRRQCPSPTTPRPRGCGGT